MEGDAGLLLLRAVVGGLLAGHGAQKLFGWFGGFGLRGTGEYLAGLGFRPGGSFALLAGLAEGSGGLLLALGLLTPLAAAVLSGTMLVVAVAGHGSRGLKGVWNADGGYEYPLVLGIIATALGFTGPGAYSLDVALDLGRVAVAWGLPALPPWVIVLGGLAGGVLALLSRVPASRTYGATS
ncbi:MAG TPA: DoxX family protein [Chloroflexota bacterium]|nr:DoxX family protein [Chloroflexota bacterium]